MLVGTVSAWYLGYDMHYPTGLYQRSTLNLAFVFIVSNEGMEFQTNNFEEFVPWTNSPELNCGPNCAWATN